MRLNWLATTAVAVVIGSGAVIAQTQSEQKREEGPRAQQTKDEKDRQKGRTAQPEQKGKEQQRGEANTPAKRKQAQEPQHDTKQPTKQSQDQQKRGEPSSAPAQQSQEQQKGRDTKQSAEPKQQKKDNQARDTKQPEQKNQARDAKQPTDTKQQQGQQQPSTTPSSNQAAQPSASPSTTPTQQSAQPSSTGQTRQGQTTDPTRSGTSASVSTNDPQRKQAFDRLRNDRAARNPNINIQVSIGERLPSRVRARALPPDIVRIEPRYRGYEYTVVEDQVYIVEPRTKKVVDIIREPSSSVQTQTTFRSDRIVLSTEQRETLKQSARRLSSAPVAATPPGSSVSGSSCLTLQPVPEELTRANPELSQYQMLAIGDQVVLVDPREQKIVEVVQ